MGQFGQRKLCENVSATNLALHSRIQRSLFTTVARVNSGSLARNEKARPPRLLAIMHRSTPPVLDSYCTFHTQRLNLQSATPTALKEHVYGLRTKPLTVCKSHALVAKYHVNRFPRNDITGKLTRRALELHK